MWLELYKAVSECLPRDAVEQRDIRLQNRILITKFTPRRHPDLAAWYSGLSTQAKDLLSEQDRKAPPSGPGYIVTLEGDHYHDGTLGKGIDAMPVGGDPAQNLTLYGRGYLREQFLKKLQLWAVPSLDSSGEVKVGGIGITHATIVVCSQPIREMRDPTGETEIPQMAGTGRPGVGSWGGMTGNFKMIMNRRHDKGKRDGGAMNPALDDLNFNDPSMDSSQKTKVKRESVNRTHFIIEFVWTPEKPQPNPAGQKGALASTAAPGGAAVGSKASAPGTAPATLATKK